MYWHRSLMRQLFWFCFKTLKDNFWHGHSLFIYLGLKFRFSQNTPPMDRNLKYIDRTQNVLRRRRKRKRRMRRKKIWGNRRETSKGEEGKEEVEKGTKKNTRIFLPLSSSFYLLPPCLSLFSFLFFFVYPLLIFTSLLSSSSASSDSEGDDSGQEDTNPSNED